jgi:hypothetical protein
MNQSEYLRRRLESLPIVYGVPQPGDESLKTLKRRYVATARCAPSGQSQSQGSKTCCGYVGRPSDGDSQVWTREAVTAAAAGAAICGVGAVKEIMIPCVPQESTVEIPRDEAGNPTDPTLKPAAYKGRVTCCPAQGLPLGELPPVCCD